MDTGLCYANGITLSPDQTLLCVAGYRTHWVYSYQMQTDRTLTFKQLYYWIHAPDNKDDMVTDGLWMDHDRRR